VKQLSFWKSCTAIALLLIPVAGRADVVQDWNIIMQATVGPQPPFPKARFAAITQLAVFEAVNAIKGDYKPYLGTITASPGDSAEAAAIAAAHLVLRTYFPASAPSLDAAYTSSLAAIPDGPSKTAGIAVGEAAANAMMAARASDGSSPSAFYLPTSTSPGQWQPTPSCTSAGGAFFQWQFMKPFGLQSGSQFRLGPPPALTSFRYAKAYNEVKTVGSMNSTERPPDRADVARFFANVTPIEIFNPIARLLGTNQGYSLSQNARLFALLNMTVSDAAVAAFDTKYHYTFWRPETAIHNAADDGNPRTEPDPTFVPYITAPCFPSYPSAHATLTNSAREVLEQIFGDVPFSITLSTPAVPGVSLTYTDLAQISADVDDARVYGGIHFRTDQDAGTALGVHVGSYVYQHNLRRAHGDDSEGGGH
jgi:hypothetical protein